MLYAIKIVARFYQVGLQYERMKRNVLDCAFVFVSNFLGMFLLKINKIAKRVKFF